LQESEELFPTEAFLQDQDVNLGFEGGEDNNQRDVPITLNETVDQMNLNEGETHFKNLFPPVTTSRKQAASAFFQLLRKFKLDYSNLKGSQFLYSYSIILYSKISRFAKVRESGAEAGTFLGRSHCEESLKKSFI